jgi:hypothetical protein
MPLHQQFGVLDRLIHGGLNLGGRQVHRNRVARGEEHCSDVEAFVEVVHGFFLKLGDQSIAGGSCSTGRGVDASCERVACHDAAMDAYRMPKLKPKSRTRSGAM